MEALLGGIFGFTLFSLTSTHRSPVRKRIPHLKVRNIHISPSIRIELEHKIIHLHHWMIFGAVLVAFVMIFGFIKSEIITGFISGSTLQGLTFNDRFSIIQRVIRN